jgi:hypothetical protein
VTASEKPRLRFRRDGTFLIVQLSDVHWHDGEPDDLRSRALIERVLDVERPDLVALTGDIVGGYASRDPAEALRQSVKPIVKRRVPWAMVFGNHDDEGALARLDLLAVQQEQPLCLTQRGPATLTGVGNYVLRLSASRSDDLAAALFFLDSGGYAEPGFGHYAWIAHDQIAWHLQQAHALAHEYADAPHAPLATRLPMLAFFHIPLPEYNDVWQRHPCRGHRGEPVCCPALNSGLFAALVETGVLGSFVGHDHLNDFEGALLGVRLCYGRASGYATYGRDDFARGARVIRLREGEPAFETWMRLADGTVLTDPPLHLPTEGSTSEEE